MRCRLLGRAGGKASFLNLRHAAYLQQRAKAQLADHNLLVIG